MHSKRQFCNSLFRSISRVVTAALPIAIALALTVALTQSAQAQTFTVIHNFTGGGDGAFPLAGLTRDQAGNLYGTTGSRGASGSCIDMGGCGTVFRLSKKGSGWILTTLYDFTGGNDGASPQAGVLIGSNGSLYGTTMAAGGGGDCQYQGYPSGCGTVFNLRPPAHASPNVLGAWTETTIHAFQGNGDGAYPLSGLIFDEAGNLYGTTSANGEYKLNGVVYKLTPSPGGWTESTLHTFTGGSDGSYPAASVIFDKSGNLYGTTADGGTGGYGTAFQLMPTGSGWTENVLYSFDYYGSDGGMPVGGLILDKAGNLYGATADGYHGATVFMLSPSDGGWVFNVLYTFSGSTASLVMDAAGNLYGTTISGGGSPCGGSGCGTVFRLTPGDSGWIYTSLHDFTGNDGKWPYSNVIFDANGNLYGTASQGGTGLGCSGGCGVVWEISP